MILSLYSPTNFQYSMVIQFFSQTRRKWSGCKWTRTQNDLVYKRTLNHLSLRTKCFWVRVQLHSLKLQISRLLRARSSLTFRQLQSMDSLWNEYVTWQEHTVKKKITSPCFTMCFAKTISWDTNDMRKKLLACQILRKKCSGTTSSSTQMLLFWQRHKDNPQRVFRQERS